MFADLLLGRVTMPPPPPEAVLPVSADRHLPKTWGNGVKAEKMQVYLEKRRAVTRDNRAKIIAAMDDGLELMPEIAEKAEVSRACAFELLHQLKDEGYVLKVELTRNRFKWVRTSKHLPHSYSTGPRHTDASEEVSKEAVGKTVFDGEGV